ncbi:MAG: 23S rRNA (adenine(2503)-C(2))-methyltransferase RlmN [Muribaculaceae bacterium]|nr:23S rRNA (adenine(2503)-C(2))-methyltransferase RlmN [Muribaculaceae bacterium]
MDSKTVTAIPLIGMTLQQLREVAAANSLPQFAAKQMAQWLYEKRVTSIDEMTNLSIKARNQLKIRYTVGRIAPKAEARSVDGTAKYLFDGAGGRDIEAVYIPDRDRATLCISSQAGCRMGCRFCMTGRQGFHGNLTAAAIINQILSIPESGSLTNIVFMGMGEPTDNLEAVMPVIEILTSPWGMAWSPKRITVSTIGRIKPLKVLLEQTKVHIAVSLHSPFASERESLMPIERACPSRDLLGMLRNYDFSHQRRLSMEYIMWKGLNDDTRHADALARLLKGLDCRVNLIRYHSLPDSDLLCASSETMTAFRDRLNDAGITATIRTSRGEDIQAACGLLAGKSRTQPS